MRHIRLYIPVTALLLAVLISAPPEVFARYQPTHGSDMYTAEQEIQIGQQAAAQTNRQYPVLPESSPITQYVQRIGAKLAAHAPGEKWPFSYHVINQKEVNAFALPGGPIYINVGTIQAADNEAQLAGVMAHETSHVVQRHATKAATKEQYAQVGLGILGALIGRGIGGQLAALGTQFAVGSYFLKNSRANETEADLIGTDIMYDTGYDPHQMAVFFEKLEKEGGARGPQFLSDHPNPGNRYQAVSKEVATLPRKSNYIVNTPEFDQIHQQALGMKALTAQQIAQMQKQGGSGAGGGAMNTPTGISASSNYKQLNHNAFVVDYPDNWQVFGDQSSAVTIAPQGGVSQDAVAYGVMINAFEPEEGRSGLDDATHQLMQQLHQSNPDMKQVGNDENIKVNGMNGKSVDFISSSPLQDNQGRRPRERDWLVALQSPTNSEVLYLVFVAPQHDFDRLRPTFEHILRSFRLR